MEQVIRKTKSEIIDHIVEHFKTHPRGYNPFHGTCTYSTLDGLRCAHSICIQDHLYKGLSGSAINVIADKGDEVHKPEFRGHQPSFWQDMQALHDAASNWIENNTGGVNLSESGNDVVEQLKEVWKQYDAASSEEQS